MTEKELRPIVQAYLQGAGYFVAHEVMLCGFCDLVGCIWAERIGRRIPAMIEIVSVELKIKDFAGVLYQAKTNKSVVDFSYAAMPWEILNSCREKTINKFRESGIGLFGVDIYCGMKLFVPAKKNLIVHDPNVLRRLWNYKIRTGRKKK